MTINSRTLVVGEILFDVFESGNRILGGAPFNVAWNLKGLGAKPLLLSSVGEDDSGEEALRAMRNWGLDTRAVHISRYPTGTVNVILNAGEPVYDILADQAYDDIPMRPHNFQASHFSMLYHGSLAFRSESNLEHLKALQGKLQLPKFVDINLRPPWYSESWVHELLSGAEWVKLNRDELAGVTKIKCDEPKDIRRAASNLKKLHNVKHVFVTAGRLGAFVLTANDSFLFAPSPNVSKLQDTVGAGDAFSAAAIVGIQNGIGLKATLEAAVAFAAKACSIEGATTTNASHYELDGPCSSLRVMNDC